MQIRIGILGVGTVGQGVLELLGHQRRFFTQALGFDFEVVALGARSKATLNRAATLVAPSTPPFLTTDPLAVATHPDIDIFIEVAGGEDAPLAAVEAALKAGKHVITANKALLAKHGTRLFPLAARHHAFLAFEAAVGGGIPIIKTLQESLIGNDIQGLACIINGTCNYILTEMSQKGAAFEPTLAEAQRLGYAEADPTFDIDGLDALHKVSLLASLAYGCAIDYRALHVEGIRGVSSLDIAMAAELGYVIKLLGVVTQDPDGRIFAAVYPALVERSHQLAAVNGVLNAVYLKTSAVGPLLLTGAGAGKLPTASSIVSDLLSVARQMATGHAAPPSLAWFAANDSADNGQAASSAGSSAVLKPIDELETEYYLRLTTLDRPGVLAKVTGILGDEGISIRALFQKPEHDPENVPVFITTHLVKHEKVRRALTRLDALDIITAKTQVLRFWR
jgi:homoserine dehydrogenase